MPRFFKLIAKIENKPTDTYYLFDKESRSLLPIEPSARLTDSPNFLSSNPLVSLCHLGNMNIRGIRLYLYCDDMFYFHLQIEKEHNVYELNISPKEALELSASLDKHIEVDDQIAQFCGIHISQELLDLAKNTGGD